MRVMVLGAGGLLGREIAAALSGTHTVLSLARADADVTSLPGLLRVVRAQRPEVIINCAAATDVDRCERDPAWAWRVNAGGAWCAAAAAAATAARLIHFSTDFVFPGDGGHPYDEWAPTRPLNVYGHSKLAGETAVLRAGARACVVRTQQLFGRHGPCFPLAILRGARRVRGGELPALRVVSDHWAVPTSAAHLARKVAWLLEWEADGLYHLNAAGECTRLQWAAEVLRLAGFHDVPIEPICAAEWPADAIRPARATLRRRALELMGADDMPPWQLGTAEYIAELRAAGEL